MVVAYKNITNAYMKIKKLDLVMHYYLEAIKNNPDDPRAYELLGDFYYKNKNLAEADKMYRNMLKADPKDPGALIRNSLMDFSRGDFELALQKIDFYLILRPNNKKALILKEKILTKSSHDYDTSKLSATEPSSSLRH